MFHSHREEFLFLPNLINSWRELVLSLGIFRNREELFSSLCIIIPHKLEAFHSNVSGMNNSNLSNLSFFFKIIL